VPGEVSHPQISKDKTTAVYFNLNGFTLRMGGQQLMKWVAEVFAVFNLLIPS